MTPAVRSPLSDPDEDADADFDDLPETHLDDEAYEAFVRNHLDRHGRPKLGPPVGWVIVVLIALALAAAVLLFR